MDTETRQRRDTAAIRGHRFAETEERQRSPADNQDQGRQAMQRWYAVFATPRLETLADEHLRRQGYETYLPRVRRTRRRRDKWETVIEALFPRYLFVHVDVGAYGIASIRSTRGVSGLVRFGHELVPLPVGVVEYLKSHANPTTGLHEMGVRPLKRGERVRVLDGPLAGLEAVFQAESGADRALILMDLLGRASRVLVSRQRLAACC